MYVLQRPVTSVALHAGDRGALAAGRRIGMNISEERAISWITLNAARSLGIADQTGSLEAGKRADVVIWSANPFSVYARADQVFIDFDGVNDDRGEGF